MEGAEADSEVIMEEAEDEDDGEKGFCRDWWEWWWAWPAAVEVGWGGGGGELLLEEEADS